MDAHEAEECRRQFEAPHILEDRPCQSASVVPERARARAGALRGLI